MYELLTVFVFARVLNTDCVSSRWNHITLSLGPVDQMDPAFKSWGLAVGVSAHKAPFMDKSVHITGQEKTGLRKQRGQTDHAGIISEHGHEHAFKHAYTNMYRHTARGSRQSVCQNAQGSKWKFIIFIGRCPEETPGPYHFIIVLNGRVSE